MAWGPAECGCPAACGPAAPVLRAESRQGSGWWWPLGSRRARWQPHPSSSCCRLRGAVVVGLGGVAGQASWCIGWPPRGQTGWQGKRSYRSAVQTAAGGSCLLGKAALREARKAVRMARSNVPDRPVMKPMNLMLVRSAHGQRGGGIFEIRIWKAGTQHGAAHGT